VLPSRSIAATVNPEGENTWESPRNGRAGSQPSAPEGRLVAAADYGASLSDAIWIERESGAQLHPNERAGEEPSK
jgi:hypothetical protein